MHQYRKAFHPSNGMFHNDSHTALRPILRFLFRRERRMGIGLGRARGLMRNENVEAIIVFANAKIAYYSGHQRM
jgi:hypothetical protein